MSPVLKLALLLLPLGLAVACGRSSRPESDNELPFGWMDAPAPGAVLSPDSRLTVSGWALDDSQVVGIRIYVDNRLRVTTRIIEARPDLSKPYPGYMKGTDVHGFRTVLDQPLTPGSHTIMAQAIDDGGATRDLTTVTVTAVR
jgi:hypothetical protein